MPFTVSILDHQECYTTKECQSTIIESNENQLYPCLTFVTNYYSLYDEDGESPPKYLLQDEILEDLIEDELQCMGVSNLYKVINGMNEQDIEMRNIYVVEDKQVKKKYPIVTKEQMKNYKFTQFKVPINYRRLKRKCSSKNARNKLPLKIKKISE